MIVIKRCEAHRPFAEHECKVMVIEPTGVINTGSERGPLTAENDVWI